VHSILGFSTTFAASSCYTVSTLNQLSAEYSKQTDRDLEPYMATAMIQNAIDNEAVDPDTAHIDKNDKVADQMWAKTGLSGDWEYKYHEGYYKDGEYEVFQRPGHFEGSTGGDNETAFDPYTGKLDDVADGKMDGQKIISTREFIYTGPEKYTPPDMTN